MIKANEINKSPSVLFPVRTLNFNPLPPSFPQYTQNRTDVLICDPKGTAFGRHDIGTDPPLHLHSEADEMQQIFCTARNNLYALLRLKRRPRVVKLC
jgi:hypothetical protein